MTLVCRVDFCIRGMPQARMRSGTSVAGRARSLSRFMGEAEEAQIIEAKF
jgi:hypothetical protein